MAVMMQAFYWDSPRHENKEHEWWNFVAERVEDLGKAGFNALWLPPVSKAASHTSMGYDPYDYFDLGDFDQKGGVKTWYGNRAELEALIAKSHKSGVGVYADMVINHNSGADAEELNPIDGQKRWTKFNPKSGIFPRDYNHFNPCRYEQVILEGENYAGYPHLCHRNPEVYAAMYRYARLLIEELGFDGFRFDYVKGFGPWMIKALAERRFNKWAQAATPAETFYKPFCVGEYWDGEQSIDEWLNQANSFNDNPVSAFDFPLRYHLKDLCDTYGYDLRGLLVSDSVLTTEPDRAATFVDNHDTTQNAGDAVIHDKLLAYAFILTHQGYPCVFWPDYFNYGLARTGTSNGLDALIAAHENYAAGYASNLWADHDLYIMQRSGYQTQHGLVFVLNNLGDAWHGATVQTQWTNRHLTPIAWDGYDQSRPAEKYTGSDGRIDLYAAPRGFVVYAPA